MTGPPPPLDAWTADCAGVAMHFAVFQFGRQRLVWASPDASLGPLALATPPRFPGAATPVATLVRGRGDDGAARALAARLAARAGAPVLVAWGGAPTAAVREAAERELVARLGERVRESGGMGG
jgi:hypothetical protein